LAQTLRPLSKIISAVLAELITLTLPSPGGRGGKGEGKQDAFLTDHQHLHFACGPLLPGYQRLSFPALPRRKAGARGLSLGGLKKVIKKPLLDIIGVFCFK
jgi:hypothetical protein